MAKQYKGSLSLDWYNKQKAILLRSEEDTKTVTDIPAPKINWVNKDEALFYEINIQEGKGIAPFWVDRNDIRVKEARPLILQKAYKAIPKNKEGSLPGMVMEFEVVEFYEDDATIENILIKGDNLLALNTLKKTFDNLSEDEKVKLIYIDPPFNTGQAFEYYDDNLAHSEWLTLMRDRITVLKQFLRYDGIIVVHLDNVEVHYCKLILDEIFGRDNFISHIAYERSSVAGLGQGGIFVNTSESILVYHNGIVNVNTVYEIEDLPIKTMKRYNKYIKNFGKKQLIKTILSKSNGLPINVYEHSEYEIETISMANAENRYSELLEIYKSNIDTIFRPFLVQQENEFQHELMSYMENDRLYSVEYTPSRGKNKDKLTTLHYMNNGLFAWLKDTTDDSEDAIGKKSKLSNFWKHSDIPKADLHNEGNVTFARNKKPENLLQRLIDFATDEGDTVLDCFGGSGTTFATAHKMNRKWIGVEIGNHIDTHIIPRLKSVLINKDDAGISKKVNWQGGGSFKYYHLGESIIKLNEDGTGNFNWSLGKVFIQESFLSSYDYTIDTSIEFQEGELFSDKELQPLVGVQTIGTKKRVAVITLNEPNGKFETLSYEEMQSIYKTVKKKFSPEYINIFTNRGIEIAYDSKPVDLEVVKIPNAIFAELEK
jgi:adenine specific DNA methylase Mod